MSQKRSIEGDDKSMESSESSNNPTSLKDLILDLKWSVRDRIINNLSNHSAFLFKKIKDNRTKEEKINENFELIQTLMNLPSSTHKSNIKKQKLQNNEDDEITLDLKWTVRDSIVDNLLKNHHSSILFSNQYGKDIKSNLVKENNDLASVLTNLPVRGSIEEISLDENSDAECEENQNAEEVETNLNGASTSTDKNLVKPKHSPAENTEIADIKNDLNFLKKHILSSQKPEKMKPEVTFNFKVSLKLIRENKIFFSNPFYCKNIQFFAKLLIKTKDDIEYLSYYIQSNSNLFSFDSDAQLSIINQIPTSANYEKSFDYQFFKPTARGFSDFIPVDQLLDRKNEFINSNDEIEFQVYLKIKHLEKVKSQPEP